MGALSLDGFVAIPVPTDLYLELVNRYPSGVSSVVEQVVWDFLDRTEEDCKSSNVLSGNGIYWASVYLPSGTKLRVRYFDEYKYAEIREDKIIYEEEAIPSVSQVASRMRNNTSVNAWINVEIKRPNDREWILADRLR